MGKDNHKWKAGIGVFQDNIKQDRRGPEDRRKASRLEFSVPVRYHIQNSPVEWKSVSALDMSLTGIRIVIDQAVAVHSIIELEVKLPGIAESFQVTGEVKWIQPAFNDVLAVECGIAFHDIKRMARSEHFVEFMANKFCQMNIEQGKSLVARPASSVEELKTAYRIIYKEYVRRGYCKENAHGMHYTHFSMLPDSRTFVLEKEGAIHGTLSLIPDSSHGLPMESLFPEEIAALRAQGRKLAENSLLALDQEILGHGLFSLTHSEKHLYFFSLVKIMLECAKDQGITDLVIAVHPKHEALYRFLTFEPIGPVRAYAGAQGNPALPMRWNIENPVALMPQDSGIRAYLSQPAAPEAVRRSHVVLTPEIISEFLAPPNRPKILFFSEAVTLAHVARPLALAETLDTASYEVHIASSKTGLDVVKRYGKKLHAMELHEIKSISAETFMQRLAKLSPVYDTKTLKEYVLEDLKMIREIKPDFIVGDFRLSLAVSAEIAGIPYASLTNAYWSPLTKAKVPAPDGVPAAIFKMLQPLVSAIHSLPLNNLRKEFGLPALGFDTKKVYTHGTYTLYCDPKGFIPMKDLPANHQFIGPIHWSPAIPFPAWWENLPQDKPLIYVTMGSSGDTKVLDEIIETVKGMPVTVVVTTAGRKNLEKLPENVYAADYLPGDALSKRADLVICNGGSPTTYQALRYGTPVIGIPANLDQLLNMQQIEAQEAGRTIRRKELELLLGPAVRHMLEFETYSEGAKALSKQISKQDFKTLFPAFIAEALSLKIQKNSGEYSHV